MSRPAPTVPIAALPITHAATSIAPSVRERRAKQWLAARQADLLPVPYFHVVFTVPAQIAAFAFQHKAVIYAILFDAAAETLKTIAADPAHLGGEIGFLAILHTWGQALTHHLHIHCLVPGVALSSDGRWLGCRPRFFLPIHVLSRLFRRLFLERLQAAYTAGRLRFSGTLDRLGDADAFAAAIRQLRRKNWIVYAKPPFGSPEHVLAYLGRYTHRVAIANSRLVSVDDTGVTFRWRDYRHGNAPKLMELAAHEFIRRFLLHSLPLLWRHSAHHRYAAALAHRAVATMARHVMTIGYRTNIDRGSVAVSAPTDAMMPHVRHVADPPANQKHHPAVRPKMPMGASIASTNAGTSASSLPTWWHRITQVRSPGTSAATLGSGPNNGISNGFGM